MSNGASTGIVTSARMNYSGGCNVTYDLTGRDSEFLKSAQYVHYINGEQVIELPVPAFVLQPSSTFLTSRQGIRVYTITDTVSISQTRADKVEIGYVADKPSGETSEAYWTSVEDDQTAMGKAFYLWNNVKDPFDGKLSRKILIHLKKTTNVNILIEYQAFWKDAIDTAAFHGESGPQYTREFGQHIVDALDELKAKTEIITRNMFGNTPKSDEFLLEDLTAQMAENYVTNELHEFNTATGHTLLSPGKGSFYPGVVNTNTCFKMYKHFVKQDMRIGAEIVISDEYLGWLFIYNENQLKVYVVTKDETFLRNQSYFKMDRNGFYVRLVEGTGKDYRVGDDVSTIKDYVCLMRGKFEEGVTYYIKNVSGNFEITTDYVVGAAIPPGKYYIYQSVSVYNVVPQYPGSADNSANFVQPVNDTTAVITSERRVVLTRDNIKNYEGFIGNLVDISCKSAESKELVLGTDYEFTDVNLAKTEKTFTEQPVYDHIRMLVETNTDETMLVGINYQAFGGQVMPSDVRNIRQDLANAMAILGEHQLLTVNNLAKQPMITELNSRVRRMEEYHNHFTQVDHLVYKGMKGFHWINFATLYDLHWFEDLGDTPIKEIGTFRVSSRDQRWCYEFTVTVDLSKDEENCLSVKTLGATGVDLNNLEEWQNLPVKERIGVRLCWNGTGKNSGAVLQLGWDFDNYNYDPATTTWDNDTITITNKSGNTSFFRLYSNPLEITKDADASINIFGHVLYVPFEGITGSTVPYFKAYQEYMYYLTGSVRIQSGVTYYKRDPVTGTYEKDDAVYPGQLIKDLTYSVYERSAYRVIYKRETVAAGTPVTLKMGYYVVDDTNSFSDYSFTFINQMETWDHVNNPTYSKCSTMYLEDNSGGLTVWLGNYPVRPFSFGPKQGLTPLTVHCCLTPEDQNIFNADKIKNAVVLFYDRKEGRYFTSTLTMCSSNTSGQASFGDGFWFMEDMCGMSLRIYDSNRSRYYYYAITDNNYRMIEGKAYYLKEASGDYKKIDQFVPTGGIKTGGGTVCTYFPTAKYHKLYKTETSDALFQDAKIYYKFDNVNKVYVELVPGPGGDYLVSDTVASVGYDVYDGRNLFEELDTSTLDKYNNAVAANNVIYAWYVGFPATTKYVYGGPAHIVQINAVYDIDLQIGVGTSSWLNDRFDLRQIKIHF